MGDSARTTASMSTIPAWLDGLGSCSMSRPLLRTLSASTVLFYLTEADLDSWESRLGMAVPVSR
jgi:hypothetical protein